MTARSGGIANVATSELRRRGEDLVLAGKHALAAELFAEAFRRDRDPRVALKLGDARRRLGELEAAAKAYEAAAKLFDADALDRQASAAERLAVEVRKELGHALSQATWRSVVLERLKRIFRRQP